MLKGKIKFDYSWVIIGLMFATVCLSLGFCSSGRTLYLTAITDALDIPRSAFSINNTIRFTTSTVVSLFFGTLVQKFGTKKLLCTGFACLLVFAVINAYASELWMFYIASVFLGTGLSWTSTSMASKIVNAWCTKNKATITGAVLAANGIGGAVAIQIISPIIFSEGNPFGYRDSYKLVAIIMVVMLLLLLVFYRNPPKDRRIPTEKSKKKARGVGWIGMDYSVAIKKPYFYVMFGVLVISGIVIKGTGNMATPHYYDLGLSKEFVAALASLGGLLLSLTKFLTGYFYDRFGIRFTASLSYLCAFSGMVLILFIDNSPYGYALATSRAIIVSFATPIETVMLPIFASELFGDKSFDKIVGIYVAIGYAGGAIGAPLGNLCFDILGSYNLAFAICAILMLSAFIAMQFIISSAKKDKEKILAEYKAKETINA